MPINPLGNPADDFDIDTWLEAISGHESGGDTGIQRLDSHGATGKYQITKDNIRTWSKELYGEEIDPETFAAAPAIQEAMARAKFKEYYQKRGGNLREVAKDWYGRGKTLPGHPTPDQYADRQVRTYEALRARKAGQQQPAASPQASPFDGLSEEEFDKLTPEQFKALQQGSAAPAPPPAMPTVKGTEGQRLDGHTWRNGRWITDESVLPPSQSYAAQNGQVEVDTTGIGNPVPGYDGTQDTGTTGIGGGKYDPQGNLISLPTSTEPMSEGYRPPSMDYLKTQQAGGPNMGNQWEIGQGFDPGAKEREAKQKELAEAAAHVKKRGLQIPHGGNLTLEQANDSLAQFVFGGSAAQARQRQDAALKAGLLPKPLSILTEDGSNPVSSEEQFKELVAKRSKGDPNLGQFYLPVIVDEQAVALREKFNKEAGPEPDDYVALQNETDPERRRLKQNEIDDKRRRRNNIAPFEQLAANRLATLPPWEQPNSPEAKKAWITAKAKELQRDVPLANSILKALGAGYTKEDYAGAAPPVKLSPAEQATPEIAALLRVFNPLTPLLAATGDPESNKMVRDGLQGLGAYFNGLSMGALSDYDPRYDEAYNQLTPEQKEKFDSRFKWARIAPRSAGTTSAIALLIGGGEVAGLAGTALEAAGVARGARAAQWIQKTIQASGFNGSGIGASLAQTAVYSAIDQAVKTGAPSLNEWAAGGGWNPNATVAENVANYFGRVVKRFPDDAAQFIIGNQWGAIAEKLAADYGLKALGREVVGRVAEGGGEAVQEFGSQLYSGKVDLSDPDQAKALITAGVLGFMMGNGGSHAPIYIKSNAGHTYQLNAGGGLDLVNDVALGPDAVVVPEGAVIGRAGLGIDDFYRAVGGKAAADQQKIDIAEQSAVESGEMAAALGQPARASVNYADVTANLAEYHRDYQAREASGAEPPQSIFGSDAGVRQAASSANEIEQQLRRDPESYIAEQEDDAKALEQVAATIKQAYEGKKGPDSILGLNDEGGVAPITDPEQLKAVKAEAIKQAVTAPDGTVDLNRAIKLNEIIGAIGEQYSDKGGFLKALDAAVATQQANAKSIRDEFGSKVGQERRYNAEVESSAAEVSRVQGELQQLNDAQAKLNEERRVTRDAVRDAEDYALTAQDGVTEAEDQLAQAEQAAEQARVPLKAALDRGGLTKSQGRKLNGAVEAADAKVEQAKKGVEKAKQIVARAGQAVQRARSVDSRKLEDLQEATKAFGAKQKEFKAAQDRESRAYDTREAFIKEQKKAAAEREAASPAPSANKASQTAQKAQNNSTATTATTASPKATSSPKSETAPISETEAKAAETTSTEYAGPEVESAPDIASKKPAERAKFLKDPVNAASLADRALANLDKGKTGSSTYIDGSEATEGYAVATGLTEVVKKGDDTTEAISKFIAREDVRDALASNPNSVLGTFVDADGNTHLEVSEVYDNEADAIEAGDIGAQQGYQRLGEPDGYQPLPFGQTKKAIADRLRNIVGPTIGLWMTEQESLDFAQPLTSMISLAAKEKNRSIEDQFNVMVKNGLLGITGHTKIKVGGTEIPAHVAEDGTVTLAQRTLTPADFVNLYMTPVTAPPEGKKKVDNDKIAEALNALVGDKIQPFEVKGPNKNERFQEWKAKTIERYVDSWLVDIKDALNLAEVSPANFKLKGFNDSKAIKTGKRKDPTRKDAMEFLGRGLNWYDKGKREAIANVAKHRPELRVDENGKPVDPFAYTAFATILGAHSPGNKPVSNGPQAIEHYVDWQADRDAAAAAGRDPDLVPLPLVNTSAFANVEQRFEVDGETKKVTLMVPGASYSRAGHNPVIGINRLAQIKFGGNMKQAINWLHTLHPRAEVLEMARKLKGGQIDPPREAMVPGAFILGTKLGAFITNLGGNLDFVTIDLWQGTGWNRQMGTIGGDGLARNEWEAEAEQAAVEALAKELEKKWRGRDRMGRQMREAFGPPRALKPAEVQGLTWYIEQQIWAAHGHTGVESVSYEESTKEYSDNWAKHMARREQGRQDVEAAWLSDLYTTTSPDREALGGRALAKDKKGRVDPSVTFGASPDLRANAATVQFLIDGLQHFKAMPKLVVSQVSEGESVTWGIPKASWVVMRKDAVTPHSVHETKKAATKAAKRLKDYRGEFQQGVIRLAGLEAQRDFLVKEIQKDSGKSREEVEAEIKNLADVHAALLPIRTELYQNAGKGGPEKTVEEYGFDYSVGPETIAAEQEDTTSAATSQSQVPALHNKVEVEKGDVIVDIGGGKYDHGKEAILAKGAKSVHVLDPFNRTAKHNKTEAAKLAKAPANKGLIANVLNVIPTEMARANVIKAARRYVKPGGKVYISVYEGDRSSKSRETSKGWQEHRPLKSYLDEVKAIYPDARIEKGYIVATVDSPMQRFFQRGQSREEQINSAAFKAWFKDSKVVDANGRPLVVYHGTVTDFDAFKFGKANPESDLGAGFYFTNDTNDASSNYGGFGPDTTNKAEKLAERIAEDEEFEGDYEEALRQAKEQLADHQGAVMPIYLSIQNPFVIGSELNSTRLDFNEEYNEEEDSYGEPTGKLVDFIDALREESSGYDDGDVEPLIQELIEEAQDEGGWITARRLYELAKGSQEFQSFQDFDSDGAPLVGSEILRKALEAIGFDGIIDHTVGSKFQKMMKDVGADLNTVTHYIAFKPTQIKSAIGNTGTFDGTNESILHMLGPTLKGEIQRIASIGGAPTTDALVSILAGKPEYLSGVANYLIKQRSKLLAGEMTVRDVAKAYIITLSSMGATEQHAAGKDVQSAAAGLDPEMQTGADVAGIPAKDFLSTKKGKTMVRPEDFMAKFFLTKDGQALLDHVEEVAAGKAELDEALFAPMTAVRAGFGNTIATTDFTFSEPKAGVYTLRNIAEFVKELNEVGKAGDPEAILGVVTKLKGIAEGKKGFIGQLLGFGGAATVDAVEINTWLLGKGSVKKGSGEAALTKRAVRPDLAPLMRQLVERGMETLAMDPRIASQLSQVEMDPATFNTIMHHWLWDRMKGTETSHAGLYKAMELAHSEDAVGHILGMVGYSGMGPATIDYYVGANAATMAHEPVHVYRRFMPKADLQIAEKWVAKATGLKVHNGQWLPAHDEALARGFEQWLLEGKLPSNAPEGLLGVFERMKAAILAVYQDHDQYKQKGQVDDFVGRLDDNIRGVFERMLGLRTAVGTPSQQAALDSYKNRAEQGKANSEKTYQVAGPDDEKFARDMMLTYCRWDFRRMPIADQRALLEEIFEVQRDGVSPRTKEEVLGPVFAGRVGEFRDSKVPAMGQAALQRRMAKRLDDATQMSPQFDSDARQILEIYRFGQHAFNALYPNKSVAKRLPSFTLYLAHYHPQMLLNVVRSRAKLAGTDIFSDKWLAKEQTLRQLVRDSLYTPTFVNVTFNQINQGGVELYQQRNVPANPEAEAALQKVRDYFGTTDNIKEVGMLAPDGSGLALFKDGWDMHANKLVKAGVDDLSLLDFITETGAARISSDGYYLNVEAGAPLTRAQVEYLEDHAYTHRETRVDFHKNVEGEWPSFEHVAVEQDEANKLLGKLRRAEREAFGHKEGYTTLYMASGQPATPQQANAAAIAAAAQQVAAAFNALDQASWQEIVADIRKAGMLSGIRTHLGNVISNTAFQIVEEAARYPAVAADMLMRLRYGQRSITASQLDNARAIYHSLSLADTPNIGGSADPESLEKARKAGLRRFTDELFGISSNTANTQTSSNDHGWNRDNKAVVAIEKITNAVFKTLQAEDAVFHSYAMRRHLLDLARVAVKNGEATSQADFLANLTEADIDQANADALIATFNNNNALSTGISNLKSSLSEHGGLGAYSKLAVELIVPFDRTPTNIIGRMFDYTPLGMILGSGGRHEREMVLSSGDYVPSNIVSKIKALEGLRKERLLGAANISDRDIRVLQREATKQLGRGSVGTIILIGAALGRLGTIMGLGDDDDWDRNEATGAQKGSMLIGGRWVSLNRMQPIGSLLVLGATIQQSLQRESTGGGVVSDTAMAALKQLMQIPSLRGFTDFGKATDDENKLESFSGRMIASFIPTIIKDIADARDSLQRDTKDQSIDVGGLFSVPVGPAMAAIPGLRETLPAKKDFLGRDLPETHWAQAFFDPFNTSPSRSSGIDKASIGKDALSDPVFKELDRLDVNITKPKRLAGESEEDYVQRLRVTGTAAYRAVEKQIATQAYKDAAGLRAKSGKVKQKEWLEDRIEDAKREATSKLKKWAEAQGKQPKVSEPEFPWEVEAAEKKTNKMPSKPSIKSIMKDTPEKPEGFDQ